MRRSSDEQTSPILLFVFELMLAWLCLPWWRQDRGESVLETILFVRYVTATSFRAYTVQAENQLGLTTHSARLIQSKLQFYVNPFNDKKVME